jgi:hypothetical protein
MSLPIEISSKRIAAAAAPAADRYSKTMGLADACAPVACVVFHPSPDKCFGFAFSQLMQFELSTGHVPGVVAGALPPPDAPQTLTIGFASADVVVTGQRLLHLVDALASGRLTDLFVVPERFAGAVNADQPVVRSIVRKDLPAQP